MVTGIVRDAVPEIAVTVMVEVSAGVPTFCVEVCVLHEESRNPAKSSVDARTRPGLNLPPRILLWIASTAIAMETIQSNPGGGLFVPAGVRGGMALRAVVVTERTNGAAEFPFRVSVAGEMLHAAAAGAPTQKSETVLLYPLGAN
jgi:hypothetical protein